MRKYPDNFDFFNEPVDPEDVLINEVSIAEGITEEFAVVSRETWNKYVEARELLRKEKQVLSFIDEDYAPGFSDPEEFHIIKEEE